MKTSNRIPRSPRSRSVGTRTANDRLCSRDRSERKRTFVVKLFVLVAITYINEISRPVMLEMFFINGSENAVLASEC